MSKNWTYNEGKALISAYASRKEEFYKTRNKKYFWQNILTDLESQDVLITPTTTVNVEVKWRSLCRAYKNSKDRGTGSTPTKFLYMDEMDDMFRGNPLICSKFSVSVGVENQPVAAPMQVESTAEPRNSETNDIPKKCNKRQNQCLKQETLELKKKFYQAIIEEKKKKFQLIQNYLKKKEEDREKKNELMLSLLTK